MAKSDHDYETLMWDESAEVASLLDEVADEDFDHATLCDGWRVRDVVSHMVVGHTASMPRMLVLIGRYGFNVPKASRHGSVAWGSAHSPERDPGRLARRG